MSSDAWTVPLGTDCVALGRGLRDSADTRHCPMTAQPRCITAHIVFFLHLPHMMLIRCLFFPQVMDLVNALTLRVITS